MQDSVEPTEKEPTEIEPARQIILYTTLGCHLCEQAEIILSEVLSPRFFKIEKVEIANSDQLIEKYALRIPVIASDDGAELQWPFDHQQVIEFVAPSLGLHG